jgi:hypothetical protein
MYIIYYIFYLKNDGFGKKIEASALGYLNLVVKKNYSVIK